MRNFLVQASSFKFMATALTAAVLSACSADNSRFRSDPFQNPFRAKESETSLTTASVQRYPNSSTRLSDAGRQERINRRTALPISSPILAERGNLWASQPVRVAQGPVTTGSVGGGNYAPLAAIEEKQPAVIGSSNGWTAIGGTPVHVQPGENVNTLSARYGVPASAIMTVNRLSSVHSISPGQQVVIPVYNPSERANSPNVVGKLNERDAVNRIKNRIPSEPIPAPTKKNLVQSSQAIIPRSDSMLTAKNLRQSSQLHTPPESEAERRAAAKLRDMRAQKTVETTASLGDKAAPYLNSGKSKEQLRMELRKAEAGRKAAEAQLELERIKAEEQKLPVNKKDGKKPAVLTKNLVDAGSALQKKQILAEKTKSIGKAQVDKVQASQLAKVRPSHDDNKIITSSVDTNRAAAQPAPKTEIAETSATQDHNGNFRWPARGRIISGFGSRGGTGNVNDGINIALPEGTPIRAAEGGTVVHADDSLKGYGKMVLVRHADGYVSVYAHNSDLKVKRGDSVKRGQVIANSGQTGNVTAPQLHFEIRKGATPIDPVRQLGE